MGEETPVEEVLGGDYIVTLNADGTAETVSEGEQNTAIWWIVNDGVRVKIDGAKDDLKYTYDGSTLATKLLGVSIILEKQ